MSIYFTVVYLTAMVAQEDLIEGKTAGAWMRELPDEEKEAIQEQIAVFREEKKKLDMEIAKWDSRGNDIIMLAKQMCMIMMEMTDFTRFIIFMINIYLGFVEVTPNFLGFKAEELRVIFLYVY